MSVAIRPYVTTASAIVGASVLAVAPLTVPTDRPDVSGTTVAVKPASVVTDVLDGVSVIVNSATTTVDIAVSATTGLPFELALVTGAAIANPAAFPNLASFLVYRYLGENPIDGNSVSIGPYLWEFLEGVLLPPAGLLPPPFGPTATDPGIILFPAAALTGLISDALGGLPDPIPGIDAYWASIKDNPVGRVVFASMLAVRAPVFSITGVVSWLGGTPAQVAKAFEAAVANPVNFPGLASGLLHNVFDLGGSSLVAEVVGPFFGAGEVLPEPLNLLVVQAQLALDGLVTTVLSTLLPAPIFPVALFAPADLSSTSATIDEPDASAADVPPPAPVADLPVDTGGTTAEEDVEPSDAAAVRGDKTAARAAATGESPRDALDTLTASSQAADGATTQRPRGRVDATRQPPTTSSDQAADAAPADRTRVPGARPSPPNGNRAANDPADRSADASTPGSSSNAPDPPPSSRKSAATRRG